MNCTNGRKASNSQAAGPSRWGIVTSSGLRPCPCRIRIMSHLYPCRILIRVAHLRPCCVWNWLPPYQRRSLVKSTRGILVSSEARKMPCCGTGIMDLRRRRGERDTHEPCPGEPRDIATSCSSPARGAGTSRSDRLHREKHRASSAANLSTPAETGCRFGRGQAVGSRKKGKRPVGRTQAG